MSLEPSGRRDGPYSRLGEAKKQIHLAIEGCDADADARDLREALALIEGVRAEERSMAETG